MKKIYLLHVILLSFSGLYGQCTALNQYPLNAVTPTAVWSNIDACNYAGEYAVVNVVAGNVYEFSTMGIHGSTISYDTELTLRNASNAFIAYNDDYQLTLQSYISWTATYTGTARIHLHEYALFSCSSNSICSNIRFRVTVPGGGAAPANNNCANATPLTPNAVCNLTNGTTAGATEDAIPDPSCDPGSINDVWYTFNSGNYNTLNLTVNLGTASFIGVEMFSSCGVLAQNLTLGGNVGNCDFNTSAPNPTVIGGLTPNTNYTFRLFTNVTYDVAGSFTTCLTTPAPPSVTVNSTSVCAGQSVTLTATPSTPGGTFSWSNGATTPSITVTPNSTTTYTVTYVNNGAANGTGTVTVNPLPSINAGLDQTACQGANVTLSGSGGNSYSWDNGVSNGVAFAPNTTTTYTVTGTDANGCTNTDQVTVTVVPNPAVTGLTTLCPNTTSQLTANANPNANTPWVSSNAAVATVSNTGLVTAVSFGTATITFTNNNGCTTTTTINVTNPTAPTFNPIAAVCSGGNIQLPAASTNNVQGTWSPAVNNTQTTTYTFTPAAGQCATTAQLTVNVNALPNINAGLDQSVCQGASATLTASGGNSYSWDNGVSNGVAFVPNATTTYTVTGTDANGCTNTDQVTVTVVPNPAVTGLTTLCPNATSQLTANANPNANTPWVSSNAAVATVSNTGFVTALSFGTSTITFTNNNGCTATTTINVTNPVAPAFNPIAAICSGAALTLPAASTNNVQGTWSPAVNNTQTTTYTFTPAAGQCATTAQLTVNVNALPNINAGVDQTICQSASATLTASGGNTYSWDNGVSNGVAFVPNATTTYTVTGTDANGCTNTDQVTVTVAPIPSVTGITVLCPNTTSQLTANANPNANNPWSSSNTAVATVSNTGLVTAVSFGTSTITFTNNNGCTTTATINVTNPIAPTFNPIAAICAGSVLQLPSASTNNVQGTWSPAVNNTQTTTYTFTPTAGQCATTAQLTVNVNALPSINAGLDQTVCQGASATLTASGGNTYSWDNGVSNGVAFVPNATTTYNVTGTDANGCTNTDQVTVTVSPSPVLSGNTVICPNTTSQLTANANPNANSPWVSSNVAVATISNSGLVTAVGFGTSTITFTNNNGCTTTATINVTNPIAPTFNPIAAVCSGGNIQLPAASTNNVQGTWSPAVNNTQTTTYTFTPSAGQCATTAQLTVTVNPNPTLFGGGNVCVGSTLQLTGNGNPSANTPWASATPAVGTVSNNGLFTALSPGSSVVTYTNVDGCSASTSITALGSVNGPSQQVTACLTYAWQGQTLTQSGTYTDTLQTVAGCDSIVTLNLTISDSIQGPTTQQSACGTYTWNGQTYTQSGTYTYHGTTQNGCDSTATLVLTINQSPINVTLVLAGQTFTGTATGATSYAWLDCATNTPIPGETSTTFTPMMSGSYAFIAINSCGSDTSNCEPIEVWGIKENNAVDIAIIPNPTEGIVNITVNNTLVESVSLYSLSGGLLSDGGIVGVEGKLDLSSYSDGCYVVKIVTRDGVYLKRLVKQ